MDNSKSAFPVSADDFRDIDNHPRPGMTLREWYAGLAMQGMMANGSIRVRPCSDVAEEAREVADALIAELAKEEKP